MITEAFSPEASRKIFNRFPDVPPVDQSQSCMKSGLLFKELGTVSFFGSALNALNGLRRTFTNEVPILLEVLERFYFWTKKMNISDYNS